MNIRHNLRFLLLWPTFSLLLLTGCWSNLEIEDLGIVSGLALDIATESPIEEELKKQGGGYSKKDLITSTYQIATPSSSEQDSKGGGSNQKPYKNISETGDSLIQSVREISLRRDAPPIGHHLKVIVINEELVRSYSLEQLLDFPLRDNDFRPSCLVLISKGQASKALESTDTTEIPAFRLIGIVDNEYRTSRILPPLSLAKLTSKMQSGSSFLLQNVISSRGEVKFAGAAIIEGKTKMLLGFLNEEELDGLTWLTGKGKGGLVKTFNVETKQPILYEVESMNSKITPHVKGSNISFDVNIESEGRISENWVTSESTPMKTFIKTAEKSTEEEVNRLVNLVIKKMQEDYQVDVAGFGNQIRIKHPKLWEDIKKDWDKTFSEVQINFTVNITITDFGTSEISR
ncbi:MULTISPECIES: Ger(x)C family spore germination protein [Metabacillus]|jgi:spore germination protein|uniref:Spore gernimation protein GerC n=2 Tax=Metabacillus TaxID=2675233 RepID=A0A179SPP6_9BACI|nr:MULTISPECIES: Ger(x)C family spore germination protein [Metabacillus]OAS82970.1 spore gernimation protein GerC [Metabacillus litoralis]QNF27528.1 Ger(x)C family spore germination protein [Metabacillus sp. KUDC1714]